MSFVQWGFAVVDSSCHLASKHKYPILLEDANRIFS